MVRPTEELQDSLDALDDHFENLTPTQVENLADIAKLGRAADDATQPHPS